jgi:hypothetical protein
MVQLVIFLAAFLCVSPAQPANADDSRLPPVQIAKARYRGAWSPKRSYVRDDLVVWVRTLWRCTAERCLAGQQPDRPDWEVAGPAVRG